MDWSSKRVSRSFVSHAANLGVILGFQYVPPSTSRSAEPEKTLIISRHCFKNLYKPTEKKDGTAILTSDQTIFNLKKAIRNQDGHYLLIKGTIEQELTVISIKDWVSKVCKAFNHKPRKIPEWKHNSSGRLQSATVTMR